MRELPEELWISTHRIITILIIKFICFKCQCFKIRWWTKGWRWMHADNWKQDKNVSNINETYWLESSKSQYAWIKRILGQIMISTSYFFLWAASLLGESWRLESTELSSEVGWTCMWEMQLIALDKLKSLQDSMQEKKIANANEVCNPHLTEIQLRLLNSNRSNQPHSVKCSTHSKTCLQKIPFMASN